MHSRRERMCRRLVGKCVADLAQQRVAREWFLEVEFFFQKLLAVFVLVNIARHVDNLQIREETFHPFNEARTSLIDHHNNRYQQINLLSPPHPHSHPFSPIPPPPPP